jgi:hypothetical protein
MVTNFQLSGWNIISSYRNACFLIIMHQGKDIRMGYFKNHIKAESFIKRIISDEPRLV